MFEKLIIKEKLCITLNSSSGSNIVPIFDYVPYTKAGYKVIDEYLEISELKAVSWIYNLAPIIFPIFELEDSESKKLLAAINLEWKSPRINFDVLIQIAGTSWQKIQAFSLLNPDPYPYREFSIGNHSLGNNAMMGFRVSDASFGLLQSTSTGDDKVSIFADLTRQITIDEPQVPIIINLSGITTPPVTTPPVTTPPVTTEDAMPLKIVSTDYTLVNLDRILIKLNAAGTGIINLTLPLVPVEGNEVEIAATDCIDGNKAIIKPGAFKFIGYNPNGRNTIYLGSNNRGGRLLFTESEGWVKMPGYDANFGVDDGSG